LEKVLEEVVVADRVWPWRYGSPLRIRAAWLRACAGGGTS
jgi:hypothetical protein